MAGNSSYISTNGEGFGADKVPLFQGHRTVPGNSVSSVLSEDQEIPYKVYWSRWWVLFIFSCFSCIQSAIWLTFSAFLAESVEFYGVSKASINFLLAVGPIACIPMNFIATPLIDIFGIRYPTIVAAWVVFMGASIRLFVHDHSLYWVIIAGQAMDSLSASIVMTAPPKISAVWFPVHERTTATAIGTMANNMGTALGFIFGFMVHDKAQIYRVLYLHSAVSGILVILIAASFPEAPPTPPSASQQLKSGPGHSATQIQIADGSIVKRGWWTIIKSYCTNPSLFILLIGGGASQGVLSGWIGLFDNSLPPFGFSQNQIEWLGFGTTIAGVIGAVVVGYFVDRFLRYMKWFLVGLFFAAAICFVLFAVQVERVIWRDFWTVLFTVLAAGLFGSCTSPLFYELCVEVSYPNPEATTAGLLSTFNNAATLVFVVTANKITPSTMNWLTMGLFIFFAFSLLIVKTRQKRLDVDTGHLSKTLQVDLA